MQHTDLFYRFGAALVIGILVGLQREYAYEEPTQELFAGVRTFALMGLSGCAAALLSDAMQSPLPLAVAGLTIGVLLIAAYFMEAAKGDLGQTTEVAAALTFTVGALCYWNYVALAVAVGVTMTVLLSIKPEMRTFIQHLTREDIYATLKFAVISAIVLPVLPNQAYGIPPLDVLNPYKIWLMVVFISGISFSGYVLVKVVGARRGIGLTGLLGGIASSTAVTLSLSDRSKQNSALAKPFAFAIIVAWTVMFARVVVVVATLDRALARVLWLPMAISAVAGLIYGTYLYFTQYAGEKESISFSNPFELGPAIKFGIIYAVVLLLSKAAQVYFGNTGIYISSLVAGLADVDAIALSMVNLSSAGTSSIDIKVATRAIVLAALANTAFKGGFAIISGSRELRRTLLPGLGLMLVTGTVVAFLI
jgi:uncharacterized membrane protein (DUF4010 family)